ncbi:MAG: transcriptional regulator [Tepidisphaeraceae bacterium]
MSLDALVANPGRLRILLALATGHGEEFVQLRATTGLTDGNLATHARRLQSAGLVDVAKMFRDGKPVTTFRLTSTGRSALESHARSLIDALGLKCLEPAVATSDVVDIPSDRSEPVLSPTAWGADDWVD